MPTDRAVTSRACPPSGLRSLPSVGRNHRKMLHAKGTAAASDGGACEVTCFTFMLCLGATVASTLFALRQLLQEAPQPYGYDSEGAVWNLRGKITRPRGDWW